ncbi:hypothetical protein AGMMS4956_14750 [Bacteroidia bacterium]|nr:hypothetical protein AGMMS4956_14750 [Bacteroidia bacterium]
MKTLKKTGSLLLCCLLASAAATAENDTLYVAAKSGTVQTYPVSNVIGLTFTATDLVVNFKAGEPQSVSLTDLRGFALNDFTLIPVNFGAVPDGITLYVAAKSAVGQLPASALTSGAKLKSGTVLSLVALPADSVGAIKVNGVEQTLTGASLPASGEKVKACEYTLLASITSIEVTKSAGGNSTTGIASAADAAAISVYPNPAGDLVTVAGEHNITSVALYNLAGQKLLQLEAANVNTVTVPLVGYSAGIYLLQITTEKGIVTKKVVKD